MSIKNQLDLTGKVAIITGSSKGIGESMARALAEQGASVVISSRKQEAVDAVAAAFVADGLSAEGIACHVGDGEQLKNLVAKTIEKFGRIDILINNAATNPVFGSLSEAEEGAFDKIMNVNVRACMTLANLCHSHMEKQGSGSVINIASVEGMKPSIGLGMYSISKAALIMLTKSQAKEWGTAGIRSNAIAPGLIQTKFSSALWQNEAVLKQVESHLPSGRMGQPDEMSGLALYLASDASTYCTGSVFTADGGYMIAG